MDSFEVTYYFRQESNDVCLRLLIDVFSEIILNLDDCCDVQVNIIVKERD